ncbi:MAG: hypothetical protein ACTSU4_00180 [Promethearchaeota archaeon]
MFGRPRSLVLLLKIGGIVEIIIGGLFLFLYYYLIWVEYSLLNMIVVIAGAFLLGYGILLIYSVKNIQKLKVIPILNVFLRILVIISLIVQLFVSSEFQAFFSGSNIIFLLIPILYDLIWSFLVLYFMRRVGLL